VSEPHDAVLDAATDEESTMKPEDDRRDAEPRERDPGAAGTERYLTYSRASRRKSVVLACVLSLMPGLGQIYVGYYQRGFVHVFAFASIIALLASGDVRGLAPFLGISLAFLYLYNVVDAGRRASLYNLALEGLGPERLPEEMTSTRGSLGGGVILMGVGALLLAHLRFDVSLYWLEEWWPLALIAFGVYLTLQAFKERRTEE
jgi:hypothetical protein